MKKSLTLTELKDQLESMRDKQEDYVSDTRNLMFKSDEAGSILTMRSAGSFRCLTLLMRVLPQGWVFRSPIIRLYGRNSLPCWT